MKKRSIILAAFVIILASATFSYSASASNRGSRGSGRGNSRQNVTHSAKPAIAGTVTAVNGTVITVTAKNNIVYTVQAGSAKITSGFGSHATSTVGVADIKVGDTIMVSGTVSSTTVDATLIRDGIGMRAKEDGDDDDTHRGRVPVATTTPGIVGTIQNIGSNSFTVTTFPLRGHGWSTTSTTSSTYVVFVSSATTYHKMGSTTTSFADLASGQRVMVRGTVDAGALTVQATDIGIAPAMGNAMMNGKGEWHSSITSTMMRFGGKGKGRGR